MGHETGLDQLLCRKKTLVDILPSASIRRSRLPVIPLTLFLIHFLRRQCEVPGQRYELVVGDSRSEGVLPPQRRIAERFGIVES